MFALSRPTVQLIHTILNPRLRRCAPYLGLTKLAPFGDLFNPKSGRTKNS